MEVVVDDVAVMYVESTAGIAGGPKAFNDLESRLATLKGRKFYGTFHYPHGPYRACVALQEDDDAGSLGLATWCVFRAENAPARSSITGQSGLKESARTLRSWPNRTTWTPVGQVLNSIGVTGK